MKRTCLMLLIAMTPFPLISEIPPRYYKMSQMKSPEQLTIKIMKVRKGFCLACINQKVYVEAEVADVSKSATGLTKGTRICILYYHMRPRRGWSGPRPIPVLIKGKTYPAYLVKSAEGKCYKPAARGASFEAPVR